MTAEKLPWGKILFLSLCMVVVITVEVCPVGVLPQVAADLCVPQSRASLLVSCYALTVVVASVPAIRLLGRYDRRLVLMLTMGAFAISTAALAFAHSLPFAITARVIGGLGHAIFFGVGMDITHRLSPPKRMVAAVSMFFGGNVVALSLAVPTVAALGGHWRSTFLVLAGCAAVSVLAARLLLPALPVDRAQAQPLLPRPDRNAAAACLMGFLWLTGHFLAFTLLRGELVALGFPDRLAPSLLFSYGVGTIAGTVCAGFVPPHRLRGAIASGFVLLCCAQIGMWLLLPSLWPSLAVAALWGLGFGAIPALNSAAMLRYSRVAPDLTASMLNSACNIGIGFGSFASGLVYRDFGPAAAFPIAAAVFAVGCLAARSLRKSEPSGASGGATLGLKEREDCPKREAVAPDT